MSFKNVNFTKAMMGKFMKVAVVLSLLTAPYINVQAQTRIELSADFERDNIRQGWDNQESCCSYSMTRSTNFKRTGNSSLRVELRKWDPDVSGSKRAELTDNSYPMPPQTNIRWWSFSSYLPNDWQQDDVREMFAQWHYKPTSGVAVGASPPIGLYMNKGNWEVTILYDSVDINIDRGANIKERTFVLGPWQKNVWNDWVFNINYSHRDDGYVRIWKNGQLVLDYRGKCWYNGSYDPQFKVGLYKWAWSSNYHNRPPSVTTSRVYYLDNVKIGNTEAEFSDFYPISNANLLPNVMLGPKQTLYLPINNATLIGSGSFDPDGTISSFTWTQEFGPSQASISSPTSANTIVSRMIAGLYRFRLTAKDNDGAIATSTIDVQIVGSQSNIAPVANPGNKISTSSNSATVNGSSSYDPDGRVVSYNWKQFSGPTNASITSAKSASSTISNLTKGSYYFELEVVDDKGGVSKGYVNIAASGTGSTSNESPVANAGWNQNLILPTNAATLNGSASSDPDGSIASYRWRQISGPTTAPMTNASGVTNVVSNMVAGSYIFELTVTDNQGASSSARMTINLTNGNNTAPTANAGWNQLLTLPVNAATLNGSSSTDPDGSIASYRWVQVEGPTTAPMSNANGVTNVVSNMVAGTYTFRLTVTDNQGATATSDVTIILSGGNNEAPTANAGWNQNLILPTNAATLNGSASTDTDGSIVSYQWTQISGPSSVPMSNPNGVTNIVSNMVAGTYTFRLTVTDNQGASASATMDINLSTGNNSAPIVNAGWNQTIPLPINSATLNGSGSSDPDGFIASYRWVQIAGPSTAPMSNQNGVTNIITDLVAGTYTFRLTVTDNNGAAASANVNIVLTAGTNQAPVADVSWNQTLYWPVNAATLNGQGSYDPDGSITSYRWNQVSGPSTATINNRDIARPVVSNLVVGTYTFQLTVLDNGGLNNSASMRVIVTNTTGQASTSTSGMDQSSMLMASPEAEKTIAPTKFNVYPNPATNFVTVDFGELTTENGIIRIYSTSGSLLMQEKIQGIQSIRNKKIDVTSFKAGMYIIVLHLDNGEKRTGKFEVAK
jgi:hypothetical protein